MSCLSVLHGRWERGGIVVRRLIVANPVLTLDEQQPIVEDGA